MVQLKLFTVWPSTTHSKAGEGGTDTVLQRKLQALHWNLSAVLQVNGLHLKRLSGGVGAQSNAAAGLQLEHPPANAICPIPASSRVSPARLATVRIHVTSSMRAKTAFTMGSSAVIPNSDNTATSALCRMNARRDSLWLDGISSGPTWVSADPTPSPGNGCLILPLPCSGSGRPWPREPVACGEVIKPATHYQLDRA